MGWIAKTDPNSGKTYYINKETRATQWSKPDDFVDDSTALSDAKPAVDSVKPSASPALPLSQWSERVDPTSGKTYYVNRETKQTTWQRPPELDVASVVSPASSTSDSQWVAKTDPASGKPYYYHKITKQTTWTKPPELCSSAVSEATGQLVTESNTSLSTAAAIETRAQEASSKDVPLFGDWVQRMDSVMGVPQYCNLVTKEVTYVKPSLQNPGALPTPSASSANSTTASASPRQDLAVSSSLWVSKVDPASGKTYYYNKETKETSWKNPHEVLAESATKASAPDATGNSPVSAPAVNVSKQPAAAKTEPAKPSTAAGATPSVWTRRIDYKTGQYIYFNTQTGETQWTDPNEAHVEHVVPFTAEVMFCIGGNERPAVADLETMSVSHTYGSVETLEGTSWITLQNGFFDPLRTRNVSQLSSPILLHDLESVTALRIGRCECLYFGHRIIDRAPICVQWSSDTKQTVTRYDLQGIVAHGAAYASVPSGIVASGGYLDHSMKSVANDVMLMNLATSTPMLLPKLNVSRACHAIAIVDLSNTERLLWFAFVFGGFDGERKSSSVERYVLGKGTWEVMNDMPRARSGHCAVTVDRTIYVIGGRSGYRVLADADVVHVQSDQWRTIKPMFQPRANFGAVYVGTLIVVVGGWDGVKYLNSVEAYDPRIDTWRRVCTLPSPKQYLGLVVLRRLERDKENTETTK